jgi:hypothetical protein
MTELNTLPSAPQNAQSFLLNTSVALAGTDARWINQVSAGALLVSRQLASPSAIVQQSIAQPAPGASLEEQLYNSRAACKIKTAAVAMHLDRDWRTGFFSQIDSLLNLDDWDKADAPIGEASFTTLLRMLLLLRAKRRPGLGTSGDGHVIAMWTSENARLTIECLPADVIRWIIFGYVDGHPESAAGETNLSRLPDVLQPYSQQQWLANEGAKSPA